jgi:hypothetical protein
MATSLSRPAEGREGHYRLVLAGTEHVAVKVPAAGILDLPALKDLELNGQFLPGHQV